MTEEDIPSYEPTPDEAYEIGDSMGRYRTEKEATRAYEAGEIDLWIDFIKPKTMEEWDAWEQKNGSIEEFENRWKV